MKYNYLSYDIVEPFLTERINAIGKQLRENELIVHDIAENQNGKTTRYKANKKKLEFALDTYSNCLLLIAQERAILYETFEK